MKGELNKILYIYSYIFSIMEIVLYNKRLENNLNKLAFSIILVLCLNVTDNKNEELCVTIVLKGQSFVKQNAQLEN